MVRIKSDVSSESIAALMIDGYAPEFEDFEALPWRAMVKDGRLHYRDWLEKIRRYQREIKRHHKESTYLTAYRNAIGALTQTFLPIQGGTCSSNNHGASACLYHGFTIGHTRGSIKSSSSRLISPSVRKDHLPLLEIEYKHDENRGRLHYIQNVFVYPHIPGTRFIDIEECCNDWIGALQFQEKSRDDYVDLSSFTSTWSAMLVDITSLHRDCPFYWRLYDHLGLDY